MSRARQLTAPPFERRQARIQLILPPQDAGHRVRNSLELFVVRRSHSKPHYTKSMSEQDFPLPPPTFEFLVFSLKTQAELRLGILSYGEQPEPPDLPSARHAIDLLAMITEKTRGNLSLEEQRLIENALTELRFRYVQINEDLAKASAAAASASPDTSTPGDEPAKP